MVLKVSQGLVILDLCSERTWSKPQWIFPFNPSLYNPYQKPKEHAYLHFWMSKMPSHHASRAHDNFKTDLLAYRQIWVWVIVMSRHRNHQPVVYQQITPQVGRKKIKNKWMLRKATKVHMHVLSSNSERTSWCLIPQLGTVIIEISSVKGLSLRDNPLRLYRIKHLRLMNWTYGDTGFYNG